MCKKFGFQVTLLFDLFLSDLLFVLLELNGVHLLERIGRCIVGLVDSRVVLLVAFDDSLRGRAVDHGRTASRVYVVLENIWVQVGILGQSR